MVTFHRVTNAENIESLITTQILNTDTAPGTFGVSTGTGTLFGAIAMPILVTIALIGETELGVSAPVETFEISSVVSDTLHYSARAEAGTVAATWPIGSKVAMRLSSAHLDEIHDVLAANENANKVFAGPATGSPAQPDFRALVAADIPNIAASKITTGTLAIAQGGTNAGTATAARASLSAAQSGQNNDITQLGALGFHAASTNYSAALGISFIAATAGVGGITITLPLAGATGGARLIVVEMIDAGVGGITIAPSGGDSLVGVTTLSSQYSRKYIFSNGVDTWYV